MAEDRLRELGRRWKESGSEQDELAYLQERVRTGGTLDCESYSRLAELNVEAAADYLRARVERGDLEREKLELAAYCSHEPARLVLGEEAPEVPGDLEEWVERVTVHSREAVPRANLLEARHLGSTDAGSEILEAVTAVEELLRCPCKLHMQRASRAAYAVRLKGADGDVPGAQEAALAAWDERNTEAAWDAWEPQPGVADAISIAADTSMAVLEAARPRDVERESARAAVLAGVASWALRSRHNLTAPS